MAISKRASGGYTAQIKDPLTGKRRSLGTFKRRADAKDAYDAAVERLDYGEPLRPEPTFAKGSIPFDEFVTKEFLTSNKYKASEKTRKSYEVETNRLIEFFGSRPLNLITNDDVLDFNEWFQYEREVELERYTDPKTGKPKKRPVRVMNPLTGDILLREPLLDAVTGEPKKRSANYRRKTAQRLRQIFTIAVKSKFIPADTHPYKSGGDNDELPSRPNTALRVILTQEAANMILKTLNRMASEPDHGEVLRMEAEYWYNLLSTALHTGMRMSELCGLRVSDLDQKTQTVQVEHQWGWNIHAKNEELRFPAPKSRTSKRAIPMTEKTFSSLWDWAVYMRNLGSPDDLVFPRPMPFRRAVIEGWGWWGSPSNFSKHYNGMLKQVWLAYEEGYDASLAAHPLKLKESEVLVNIHMWRHLYCIICLTNGIDVNTVSNWMGHHSAAFTYETYSRYVPSRVPRNLAILDKAFSGEAQVDLF